MRRRLLAILSVSILIAGVAASVVAASVVAAQPAGDNASRVLAPLTEKNPLIGDVARQDPDGLLNLLSKLQFLMTNHGAPARAGSPPTQAETAQIAANPAFGQAYRNDAAGTLVLLREVNEALRKSRQGADLDQPRRLALVVGDSGDETWGKLGNATHDAELIARTLKSLGFELVTGGGLIDPDQADLRRAIKDFGHSIGSRTVALFYFAGHGIQYGGHNYLVPLGAALPQSDDDYDRDLVAVDSTVLRQMQEAAGRLNIVILDACRDHPPPRTLTVASRGGSQKGLAVAATPPGMKGTIIIYSTAPNDVARDRVNEGDTNSPFAKAFAAAVVKPGVEMRDTFEDVFESVEQATNGAQQPWIEYSAAGKFSFSDQPLKAVERVPMPPSTDRASPGSPLPSPKSRSSSSAPVAGSVAPRPASTLTSSEPARARGGVECMMPDSSIRTFATAAECYAHPGALPAR